MAQHSEFTSLAISVRSFGALDIGQVFISYMGNGTPWLGEKKSLSSAWQLGMETERTARRRGVVGFSKGALVLPLCN